MISTKVKRDLSLDVMRFFSICAVVMIHVASRLTDAPQDSGFFWGNIFNSLSRFAVPVFMMITGSLLLDESREITCRTAFSKYFLKVLSLFMIWSAIYTIIFHILLPLRNSASPDFSQLITAFFKGHYHFWYLYALMSFYIAMPILKKLTKKGNEKKVTVLILTLIAINSLIPAADLLYDSFSIYELYTKSGIRTLFGFYLYFLSGWLFKSISLSKIARAALYSTGGLSLLLTVILTYTLSKAKGSFINLYDNLYPNTIIFSFAVFVFFSNLFKKADSLHPIISDISRLSFGIYIIHPIILELFCEKSFMPQNPLLYIISLWLITFSLSYLMCLIISKIPVVKKIIRT